MNVVTIRLIKMNVVTIRLTKMNVVTIRLIKMNAVTIQQIVGLKTSLREAREKLKAKSRKYKKAMKSFKQKKKSLEQQINSTIPEQAAAAQGHLEVRVASLNDTITAQADQHRELAARMTELLEASEKRNEEMANEIARLKVLRKSLELQIQALTDQMQREAKINASQAAKRSKEIDTTV
jgi:chromosome segregation ATPase